MPNEYGPPYNNKSGNEVNSGNNTEIIQKLLDMLSSSSLGGIGDAVGGVISDYDDEVRGRRGLPAESEDPSDTTDIQATEVSIQSAQGGQLSAADHQQLMQLLSKSNLPSDIIDMIISRLDPPSSQGIGFEEAGFDGISDESEGNASLEDKVKKIFSGGGR